MGDDRRHWICLDRVMKLDCGGKRTAKVRHAGIDHAAIIGEERRAAHLLGQLRKAQAANHELVVDDRKMRKIRMPRLSHIERFSRTAACSDASVVRSILPFGLRGNGPVRTTTCAGTI